MNRITKYSFLNSRFELLLLFIFSLNQLNAQKTEKFYDYKWKACEPPSARYYSVSIKTDSGYTRNDYFIKERKLQMMGIYEDSLFKIRNGRFYYFHANGVLESSGKYIQGKKDGIWLGFHNNKIMSDSTVYFQGKQIGTSLSWYPNGYLSDSVYTNEDGSGVRISWFDDGSPSVAGRYSEGKKKNGKWKYYHRNGQLSDAEIYRDAKLIDKQYFDEDGVALSDTTKTDKPAQFPGGIEAWTKYISKHLYFPEGYKIINADVAKVVVTFTVNEKGEIEDVFTSVPFYKTFDNIAESVIRKSPKWLPAIDHNRKVKCRFSQLVNFQNYKENN